MSRARAKPAPTWQQAPDELGSETSVPSPKASIEAGREQEPGQEKELSRTPASDLSPKASQRRQDRPKARGQASDPTPQQHPSDEAVTHLREDAACVQPQHLQATGQNKPSLTPVGNLNPGAAPLHQARPQASDPTPQQHPSGEAVTHLREDAACVQQQHLQAKGQNKPSLSPVGNLNPGAAPLHQARPQASDPTPQQHPSGEAVTHLREDAACVQPQHLQATGQNKPSLTPVGNLNPGAAPLHQARPQASDPTPQQHPSGEAVTHLREDAACVQQQHLQATGQGDSQPVIAFEATPDAPCPDPASPAIPAEEAVEGPSRQRRRARRRELTCPRHPEQRIFSVSDKHHLYVTDIGPLMLRGLSKRRADELLTAYRRVLPLTDAWIECFWCDACGTSSWWQVHRLERHSHSLQPVPRELWEQATGVIRAEGNPTVSQFTRQQARACGVQGLNQYRFL